MVALNAEHFILSAMRHNYEAEKFWVNDFTKRLKWDWKLETFRASRSRKMSEDKLLNFLLQLYA